MIPSWLGDLRTRSNKPYLKLSFRSVDLPVVVEIDDALFLEFVVTSYYVGDDGVGSFEYHGFKGNHSRPFVKVEMVELAAVNGDAPDQDLKAEIERDFVTRRILADCEELPES